MGGDGEVSLPSGRVALLFTDVQGSTVLLHQLGSAYGEVLDEHDRILRGVWQEFGGVEVDNEGDAFFVAFADHSRAVEAAVAAQQRLAAVAWPGDAKFRVRMGLHSGEPAIRGSKYWGVDVHYAARLGSAAHGGQVLLSADMRAEVPHAAVESLGRHGVKDFPVARELFHLVVDGSSGMDFPPPRTLTTVRSNLPTIDTPIIGRHEVIADLRGRLTGPSHLVTLVGPGGVGKTRTAIAVGESLVDDFPDGVGFVALAALRDLSEVPSAIAESLQATIVRDADPLAALAGVLRGSRSLLVLDNAEHLLPGLAELLGRLLEAAPDPRWLVTSQAPTNTRAETLVRLGPLEVPFEPERSVDELEFVPAAALLLERVRTRIPDYEVPADEQVALVELCRGLEGLPLALELAAARVPMLGLPRLVDAIGLDAASALGRGADDLPARQRGLHAALDWTVSLLDEFEREVYATCAAFAQAWSIEDAEQMFAGIADATRVWDASARLLDISLVAQRGDGRFTMPERVRRHAAAVLGASGREHETRTRHARLVAERAEALMIARCTSWERSVADLGDLIEDALYALAWAARRDDELYREVLAPVMWPLYNYGRLGPFVEDAMDFARSGHPCDFAQGCYLLQAATRVFGTGASLPEKLSYIDSALACFEELGKIDALMEVLSAKVDLLLDAGEIVDARAELEQAISEAHRRGRQGWADLLDDHHARVDLAAGDFEAAERRLNQMRSAPNRDNYMTNGAGTYLGDCAFGRGAYRDAIGYWADFLAAQPRTHLVNVLLQIYAMAAACAGLGDDEYAVELWRGCANTYQARTGRPWSDMALLWLEEPLSTVETRLPSDLLEQAGHRGNRLGYEELIARALAIAAEVRD